MLDRLSRINTDLAQCMVALNIATHRHRFDVEQRHTRARRGYLKGDGAWLGCHSDRFRLGDFGGHARNSRSGPNGPRAINSKLVR